MTSTTDPNGAASRRDFIRTTTAAVVGSTLATSMNLPGAWAAGSDEIKVGLIGAGGRGTGAVDMTATIPSNIAVPNSVPAILL